MKEKETEVNLTEEQASLILRGERPQDMDYDTFKKYRSIGKKTIENHLRYGRMFFISSNYTKEGKRITKTYRNENKISTKRRT